MDKLEDMELAQLVADRRDDEEVEVDLNEL